MPRLRGAAPVALHVHFENGGVMHEAVNYRQCHIRLDKNFSPLGEKRVGSDG